MKTYILFAFLILILANSEFHQNIKQILKIAIKKDKNFHQDDFKDLIPSERFLVLSDKHVKRLLKSRVKVV